MFKLTYLLAFICFSSRVELGNSRYVHPEHHNASLEIVGGRVATPHSLPEVVSLAYEVYNSLTQKDEVLRGCGGTLLTHNYVLTAAHCFDIPEFYKLNGIVVKIGVHDISKSREKGAQYILAKSYVVHHTYSPTTIENDIAIIELSQPAKYTRQSKPVRLPTWADVRKTYVNQYGLVAGWGAIDSRGTQTHVLRSIKYPVISLAECRRRMEGSVPDKSICAAIAIGAKNIKSACVGDSGGPLFYDKNRTQIGVVSFGSGGGCEAGDPTVFVKVTDYLRWIEDHSDVKISEN